MPKTGMMAIRKTALVSAAIAEVGRTGAHEVTMSQIARAAGVSPALAHHYFGSKDALLLAAMRSILTEFGNAARRGLAQAKTPQDRLRAIAEACFGGHNFQPEIVMAWLSFYPIALRETEASRLLRIYQRRLISNLTHALRGRVSDPVTVAESAAAMIDGIYLHAALGSDRATNGDAAIARILDFLNRAE